MLSRLSNKKNRFTLTMLLSNTNEKELDLLEFNREKVIDAVASLTKPITSLDRGQPVILVWLNQMNKHLNDIFRRSTKA